MCKISDKFHKFLLNYSNLLRVHFFPDTVYVIVKFKRWKHRRSQGVTGCTCTPRVGKKFGA